MGAAVSFQAGGGSLRNRGSTYTRPRVLQKVPPSARVQWPLCGWFSLFFCLQYFLQSGSWVCRPVGSAYLIEARKCCRCPWCLRVASGPGRPCQRRPAGPAGANPTPPLGRNSPSHLKVACGFASTQCLLCGSWPPLKARAHVHPSAGVWEVLAAFFSSSLHQHYPHCPLPCAGPSSMGAVYPQT